MGLIELHNGSYRTEAYQVTNAIFLLDSGSLRALACTGRVSRGGAKVRP